MKSIFVFGAGKVGRALAKGRKKARLAVTLRPARRGWPARVDADVIVLAVRDRDLPEAVRTLADRKLRARGTTVVHGAGALGAEPLAPLRALGVSVAQMHPMTQFIAAIAAMQTESKFARVYSEGRCVSARAVR